MRLVRLVTALSGALLASTAAYAADKQQSGFYVHGSLGVIQPNSSTVSYYGYNPVLGTGVSGSTTISYQAGFAGTVGMGYRVNDVLRLETELDYGNSRVSGGSSVDMFAGYLAAYADMPAGDGIAPYIGAGVGFGQTRIAGTSTSGFSAFGELGLGITVSDTVTIAPAVRFLWLDNGNAYVPDSTAWLGRLSVRLAF